MTIVTLYNANIIKFQETFVCRCLLENTKNKVEMPLNVINGNHNSNIQKCINS